MLGGCGRPKEAPTAPRGQEASLEEAKTAVSLESEVQLGAGGTRL